ncbi:MAG: hypothetical protein KC940_08540, partial [Candidatus Omnitrophica bacterium]|nr:hypothetical protein [Candidatus Omnitrophota bacterium]
PLVDYAHPFDLFGGRMNAFQGLFTMHSLNRPVALHMLAQNVPFPSKVLEFPSAEELKAEIAKGYEYFAMQVHSNMEFRDAMEVCRWVRKLSPGTKIILGGHGVTCYTEEFLPRREVEQLADHVCWGDGVSFIQKLFGETREIDPVLPPMEFFIEMMPEKTSQAGVIIPGVGCINRCAFCATGNFFGGTFIKLQSPEGMYRVMERTQERYKRVTRFALFDELFLSRQEEVRHLGEMIYHGRRTNLSTASYFTFSDFRSLAQYDPDDLLRWGASRVFLGVESFTKPLPKTRGLDLKKMVSDLQSRGIETILSLILGMKHHNRENLQTEMDSFIDLGAVYNQITIESPIVGAPNWEMFKRQGRIDPDFPLEHIHGYSAHYKHPNFEPGEVLERAKDFQRRIFRERGPSILKAIEVEMNGYAYCLHHADPVLRRDKALYFERSIRNQAPILSVVRERAAEEATSRHAQDLIQRYHSLLADADPHFEKKGERLIRRYDAEVERRERSGDARAPFFDLRTVETYYEGSRQAEPVLVAPMCA